MSQQRPLPTWRVAPMPLVPASRLVERVAAEIVLSMVDAFMDYARGVSRWRTSYKLGLQDIELRYKRSVLGPFWISASLIATVLALSYLFSAIFQQDFVEYIVFLGSGLLVWNLLVAMVQEGGGSIVEHSSYLQNVSMPLNTIAGRIAFRNLIVFFHNLVAILGLLVAFGAHPTLTALWAIPGAAVIFAVGYFTVLVLGPICARFRDIPQVVQSAMQILFFLTPIIWMPSSAANRPMFTHGNPFYHLIELVRAPLLGHHATHSNWTVSLSLCAGMATLSVIVIALTRKRINLWL